MKLALLVVLLIAFSHVNSFAAEIITIETKYDNFFENVISDASLLLDPDLKKIVNADFAHIVSNSKFVLQTNSWRPRPNPRNTIQKIYNDIRVHNFNERFASVVQPIVEIACTPQLSDPLNENQSKCIRDLLRYRIIETIKIGYAYRPNTTIEQSIANLSNLNDKFKYHQIVCTVADVMNSAYEKVSKKDVYKDVKLVKYPLPVFSSPVKVASSGGKNDKINYLVKNEKSLLMSEINHLRINCKGGLSVNTKVCDNKIKKLRGYLEELEDNPSLYFTQKPAREAREAREEAQAKAASLRRDLEDDELRQQQMQQQQQQQRQQQQQQMQAESGPIIRLPNGQAINTGSGEFLTPSGSGYVGTQDGTYYTPTQNGMVNTKTGNFTPVTR